MRFVRGGIGHKSTTFAQQPTRVQPYPSDVSNKEWGFVAPFLNLMRPHAPQPGIRLVLIDIAVVNWSGFARIIRGETLALREREYIQAARTSGAGNARILFRHVMPNALPPTFVMAAFYMGIVITAEAGLSFIGLGAQPPVPSLGQMVEEGKAYLFHDLWLILVPGTVLAAIVLAFDQLGDSLRDLIDPRMQV